MLQHYDWNVPTHYYRLTQRSFTVVIAKLDTIYYSRRLAELNAGDFADETTNSRTAKLNAEILALSATKEKLADSTHSDYYVAAKNPSLNADITRLMAVRNLMQSSHSEDYVAAKNTSLNADIIRSIAVRNSMQSSHLESDRRSENSEPRALLATTKADAHTSFNKIRLLVLVVVLVAAAIWARRRADPVDVGQLARRFPKTLAHVLILALGIAWGIGKMIATGLGMLGRTCRHLGWLMYCEYWVCVSQNFSLYRAQEDWDCIARPG